MGQLDWNVACERVQADDGLTVREVGSWSEEKLFVWHKYIQLTTTAMHRKRQWAGLCYIDLFSGPGICRVRETGRRLPGSPLIAAFAPAFKRMLFVELDGACADACERRLQNAGASDFTVFRGDCNRVIDEVVRQIPPRCLTLSFIDPTGLDIHLETVRTLAAAGQVDLLILFADAYDAIRNLKSLVEGEDQRLDLMFGSNSGWRDGVNAIPNWTGSNLRAFFSRKYVETLRPLGYVAADTKIINGPRGPMYTLVYASKHERGLDFWRKVEARGTDRQGTLFVP